MLVVYNDAMIMREDYSAEAFMCVNLLVNKKDHNVMYVCNIYYYKREHDERSYSPIEHLCPQKMLS